jgi:pentatricopeptide repeat protein
LIARFTKLTAQDDTQRLSNWQLALREVEAAKARGLIINVPCYTALLEAYIDAKQYTRAFDVIATMRSERLTPERDTYLRIAAGRMLTQSMPAAQAVALLDELRELSPGPDVYGGVILCCARDEQWQEALNVLKECDRKDVQLDSDVCLEIVEAVRDECWHDRMQALHDELEELQFQGWTSEVPAANVRKLMHQMLQLRAELSTLQLE